jgi:hypothetical protein
VNAPQKILEDTPLASIPEAAWRLVSEAVHSAKDPFHTPCLATIGEFGPAQRTVVLRDVNEKERMLVCHTDRRSAKVAELVSDDRSSWLFYDRERKLQLRFCGATTIHTADALADSRWAATRELGRACYTSRQGPGVYLQRPPAAPGRCRSPEEERLAREQFAVAACRVVFIDWLYLSIKGHRRAQFCWRGDAWEGHWVAP